MKYICRKHKELGFYVDGQLKRFADGDYNTSDKKEMTALDKLLDVEKVDEKGDK